MALSVNGHVLGVAQLGPDFIVLKDPIDHPAAPAEMALSINGHVKRWPIHLPDGITAGVPETRYRPLPTAEDSSPAR